MKQKLKTKQIVKEAIWNHGKKLTDEIKMDKENRKLWEHIKKLKGEEKKREIVKIYNEEGEELIRRTLTEELEEYWKTIYQKHRNDLYEIWNQENRTNYEQNMRNQREQMLIEVMQDNETMQINEQIREHFDLAMEISQRLVIPMIDHKITPKEIQTQLKKTKDKKSPGPDGLKAELLKVLTESEVCMKELARCYNTIIETGEKPSGWELSHTKMISKNKKPTVGELRPIALLDTLYKTFMGTIREKIEKHLSKNDMWNELQAGFSKGRRIADNLFILKHCVERTYVLKRSLIVISVDFQKAFDSIMRSKLLTTMMKAKIDSKIINIIAEIYSNDRTSIIINDEKKIDIEVTSGIRQGCNGSTVLFLLITYAIIEELQGTNLGYKDNIVKVVALFFADDGLLMAENIKEAIELIKIIVKCAGKCGLKLNKEKSKILMFNSYEQPKIIEEIEVVEKIKYLGITVTNKRDCFQLHRNEAIIKARRYANLISSVIARSCNRILIGKTYWKSLAMPSFLYATEVMEFTNQEIQKLQTIENQVYRTILRLPSTVAVGALRSEIGASTSRSRDIKSKLTFVKHIMKENGNELVRKIFVHRFEHNEGSYAPFISRYMEAVEINLNTIKDVSPKMLKEAVNRWDKLGWREDIEQKTTLRLYAKYKKIAEVKWHDNTEESTVMMRARLDVLPLGWRQGFRGGNILCPCCSEEMETMEHFAVQCGHYNIIKNRFDFWRKIQSEEEDDKMAEILLLKGNKEDVDDKKKMLYQMWKKREEARRRKEGEQ